MDGASRFDDDFRRRFRELLIWRRDVRRFRRTPLPAGLLEELLALACLAPSVGLSEPWRFVRVETLAVRDRIIAEFEHANAAALANLSVERASLYARLKLAGLREAPVHLAVFTDRGTGKGHGLGRQTMPETLDYSVVAAIHTLWLAARTVGVGLGWVSILDPARVTSILDVPAGWSLTAYLCLGYPEEEMDFPELERAGWEKRAGVEQRILTR
ncbi:MAG: 5,6-dimethylbenzimidazole synthase [Bryobacteraceae bacterium]|jgi:5,6-dimethylbenzimidazole synthase